MRVLVVEDQPDLADSVARVLRREGMAVDVALDGAGALERLAVDPLRRGRARPRPARRARRRGLPRRSSPAARRAGC